MKSDIVKDVERRFGINRSHFRNVSFITRAEKIWIASSSVAEKDLNKLKIEAVGMLFGRYFPNEEKFKPTTNALQIFGKYATKNVVEISSVELQTYLTGFDIQKKADVENGFVIIKCNGDIIGCGLYKDGIIKNQIPKHRRKAIGES
jgi:NOL1/NOP2/fmu family ribosome biogenesis protein